ncbi:MAG: hypothetical protein ACKOE6_04390 [Flammeovirgaceae bacterium]
MILGLPPMSQYDAAAETLWRSFTSEANLAPFQSQAPEMNLFDRNVAVNEWQRKSEKFNFRKEDSVPDADFNEVLWAAIKGDGKKCPPPRHAAFVKILKEGDDED